MRVHVVEVGRLRFPRGWFQAKSRGEVLRAVLRGIGDERDDIPCVSYVIEHDDGHIVVDTGLLSSNAERLTSMPIFKHLVQGFVEPSDEIGPRMREKGLRPEDVRWVLPTHLDMDHAGGVGHFPNAVCLVNKREWDTRGTLLMRLRTQHKTWPDWFKPQIYDLAPDQYGPFDKSLPLTDKADVVAVPTPGHSRGHVGIVVKHDGMHLFFGGDHLIRQSWFAHDLRNGVEPINIYQGQTVKTTAKIRAFVEQFPTILLPSHDAEAAANLAAREPLKI